ncbi:hypothetical protein K523DRAFT_88420 [Schizophyllum commune Tattone D]|nr:hypothetical protein K523DRAFT_88420 [Schizophyllum commune Tattone D]
MKGGCGRRAGVRQTSSDAPQFAARGGMVIRACGAPLRWEAGASSTTTSACVGHRQDDCAGKQSGEGISALERIFKTGDECDARAHYEGEMM